MKLNGQLSGVLHVVLHMARHPKPLTSQELSKIMRTNPVVVRRIMAGLRDAGYVRSTKGHGGGWTLTSDLSQVTLLDVYRALGAPTLFAIGNRSESPECRVEAAVNTALDTSLKDAEAVLLARFGEITLAALDAEVG